MLPVAASYSPADNGIGYWVLAGCWGSDGLGLVVESRMANIQTHAEAASRIQKMILGNKVDIEERAVSVRIDASAILTLAVVSCGGKVYRVPRHLVGVW